MFFHKDIGRLRKLSKAFLAFLKEKMDQYREYEIISVWKFKEIPAVLLLCTLVPLTFFLRDRGMGKGSVVFNIMSTAPVQCQCIGWR